MKKVFIGMLLILALMMFMPLPEEVSEAGEQAAATHTQEDLQASLLSVSAGSALLPFILVLGPGGLGFMAYMSRQKKRKTQLK